MMSMGERSRACQTGVMTATRVERSGTAVLEVLREVSPPDATAFEAEYRAALRQAADSLDLSKADRVLTHWWGIAYLRLEPVTEHERDLVRRIDAGEDVGWASPEEYRTAKDA